MSFSGQVNGRLKVSKKAHLTIKALLHNCANAAKRSSPELNAYYERKIAEGKKPFVVNNAIRNKLLHRIFACVNGDRLYIGNYPQLTE